MLKIITHPDFQLELELFQHQRLPTGARDTKVSQAWYVFLFLHLTDIYLQSGYIYGMNHKATTIRDNERGLELVSSFFFVLFFSNNYFFFLQIRLHMHELRWQQRTHHHQYQH